MSTNLVADFLAERSSEEKKTLLVELLRELILQSPQQPISIQDQSGKLVGLFSPVGTEAGDGFFVEGSPSFFRELERRGQSKNLVSAEEALAYFRAEPPAK